MEILSVADLPESVQAAELVDLMVAGANAKAARVAPCLVATDPAPSPGLLAEAKLVLLGAVQRWTEAGPGAFQQQTAGPFSVTTDTRQRTGFNLWPSEIEALQELCRDTTAKTAYGVDTAPVLLGNGHSLLCALNFGGTYCSCGADLTGGTPLYETGTVI